MVIRGGSRCDRPGARALRGWFGAAMLLAAAPFSLAETRMEVEARRWAADLDMTGRIDEATTSGTTFDVRDDLGVEGDEDVSGLRFRLRWGAKGRHRLLIGYESTDYRGSRRLTRAITIGGTAFQVDEDVSGVMDLETGRVYYGYSLVDRGRIDLGVMGGVIPIRAEGRFTSDSAGSEDFDVAATMPVVGFRLRVAPGRRHRWVSSACGLSLESGDLDGSVLEWETQYEFRLNDRAGIGVGYRSFEVDAEVESEGQVDLINRGAFLQLTLGW